MHFKANTKEDIAYYIRSIVRIKGLKFESVENRFNMCIIRCIEDQMDEETFDKIMEKVYHEKSCGTVSFYYDPVGGMRIVID